MSGLTTTRATTIDGEATTIATQGDGWAECSEEDHNAATLAQAANVS